MDLEADGSSMHSYVARPEGKPGPALIVYQEAFGVNAHIQDVCERLAREGYLAIAPELFHRTAPPGFTVAYSDFQAVGPHIKEVTAETIAADAKACYDWLDANNDGGPIGCIGFCLGGRASFVTNAKLPLKVAVSFYGAGIAQSLLDLSASQHAPLLLFWGGLDKHILPEHREAIAASLREASKAFASVEISDADHGFFCDQKPAYNPVAARNAWALTKEFLEQNLKAR